MLWLVIVIASTFIVPWLIDHRFSCASEYTCTIATFVEKWWWLTAVVLSVAAAFLVAASGKKGTRR